MESNFHSLLLFEDGRWRRLYSCLDSSCAVQSIQLRSFILFSLFMSLSIVYLYNERDLGAKMLKKFKIINFLTFPAKLMGKKKDFKLNKWKAICSTEKLNNVLVFISFSYIFYAGWRLFCLACVHCGRYLISKMFNFLVLKFSIFKNCFGSLGGTYWMIDGFRLFLWVLYLIKVYDKDFLISFCIVLGVLRLFKHSHS